jgi:AcrR family transcriptional regulator
MIDAATELFAKEGFGPVSTRRIAEAAGCSETLLFRYFGGKSGLLRAISKDLIERQAAPLDLSGYDDPSELIEAYLLQLIEKLRDQAPALKITVTALVNEPELTEDFETRHLAEVEMLTSNLLRLQDSGAIAPNVDARAVAIGIEQTAFAIGFLLQIVFQRPVQEVEDVARNIAPALGQGLQGPASGSALPRAVRRETLNAAGQATKSLAQLIDLINEWPSNGTPAEASSSRMRRIAIRR